MNTVDQETKISEAATNRRWRTETVDGPDKTEVGWFKGKMIKRFKHYGTLSNPHAPSRWRITGYMAKGQPFDNFTDALNHAMEKTK